MTWVVIWDSNRFTLCFSDNMVFMGYQLPEGRKPGRWIFCSPSMNLMIKSLWFVNFKTLKLQPERPGSSCTKQEKQFYGNLQPVWYNEKNLHYGIMTIMGNSTASPSLVNEWDLIICLYNGIHDNDENDNENMFITTDIYSISETNARHKYIGKSIKQ